MARRNCMKKLLIIGFIAIGTLNAAASNPDVPVDSSSFGYGIVASTPSPTSPMYTNPDVDATTRKNWYAFNKEFKYNRDQMILDDMIDDRNVELEDIKRLLTVKKRIDAERQRLFEQGQRVPIIAPRPLYPR